MHLSKEDSRRNERSLIRDYFEVLAVIAVVTVGGWFTTIGYRAFGHIYLLAVIALSLRVSRWAVLVAAAVSGLAWNFLFVPPRLSFSVLHLEDTLLLAAYFVTALVASKLATLRSAAAKARRLAESEKLREALLDGVAHELRTPVAVLRSAAEQMVAAGPEKRERLAAEILTAAVRLDQLVSNLLNQTRLESGAMRPILDWCDARDLVAAARRAVGDRFGEHPLRVNIPPDMPIFRADALLMEEVIAHLLLNAAVHTPPSTAVSVDAGALEVASEVYIAVSDEGPGVPPEMREAIFQKFNRGPKARTGGLGLGLSIVRGFMRAQGGDVSLEPAASGGARFTLILPYSEAGTVPSG